MAGFSPELQVTVCSIAVAIKTLLAALVVAVDVSVTELCTSSACTYSAVSGDAVEFGTFTPGQTLSISGAVLGRTIVDVTQHSTSSHLVISNSRITCAEPYDSCLDFKVEGSSAYFENVPAFGSIRISASVISSILVRARVETFAMVHSSLDDSHWDEYHNKRRALSFEPYAAAAMLLDNVNIQSQYEGIFLADPTTSDAPDGVYYKSDVTIIGETIDSPRPIQFNAPDHGSVILVQDVSFVVTRSQGQYGWGPFYVSRITSLTFRGCHMSFSQSNGHERIFRAYRYEWNRAGAQILLEDTVIDMGDFEGSFFSLRPDGNEAPVWRDTFLVMRRVHMKTSRLVAPLLISHPAAQAADNPQYCFSSVLVTLGNGASSVWRSASLSAPLPQRSACSATITPAATETPHTLTPQVPPIAQPRATSTVSIIAPADRDTRSSASETLPPGAVHTRTPQLTRRRQRSETRGHEEGVLSATLTASLPPMAVASAATASERVVALGRMELARGSGDPAEVSAAVFSAASVTVLVQQSLFGCTATPAGRARCAAALPADQPAVTVALRPQAPTALPAAASQDSQVMQCGGTAEPFWRPPDGCSPDSSGGPACANWPSAPGSDDCAGDWLACGAPVTFDAPAGFTGFVVVRASAELLAGYATHQPNATCRDFRIAVVAPPIADLEGAAAAAHALATADPGQPRRPLAVALPAANVSGSPTATTPAAVDADLGVALLETSAALIPPEVGPGVVVAPLFALPGGGVSAAVLGADMSGAGLVAGPAPPLNSSAEEVAAAAAAAVTAGSQWIRGAGVRFVCAADAVAPDSASAHCDVAVPAGSATVAVSLLAGSVSLSPGAAVSVQLLAAPPPGAAAPVPVRTATYDATWLADAAALGNGSDPCAILVPCGSTALPGGGAVGAPPVDGVMAVRVALEQPSAAGAASCGHALVATVEFGGPDPASSSTGGRKKPATAWISPPMPTGGPDHPDVVGGLAHYCAADGTLVPARLVCESVKHCSSGSDEAYCTGWLQLHWSGEFRINRTRLPPRMVRALPGGTPEDALVVCRHLAAVMSCTLLEVTVASAAGDGEAPAGAHECAVFPEVPAARFFAAPGQFLTSVNASDVLIFGLLPGDKSGYGMCTARLHCSGRGVLVGDHASAECQCQCFPGFVGADCATKAPVGAAAFLYAVLDTAAAAAPRRSAAGANQPARAVWLDPAAVRSAVQAVAGHPAEVTAVVPLNSSAAAVEFRPANRSASGAAELTPRERVAFASAILAAGAAERLDHAFRLASAVDRPPPPVVATFASDARAAFTPVTDCAGNETAGAALLPMACHGQMTAAAAGAQIRVEAAGAARVDVRLTAAADAARGVDLRCDTAAVDPAAAGPPLLWYKVPGACPTLACVFSLTDADVARLSGRGAAPAVAVAQAKTDVSYVPWPAACDKRAATVSAMPPDPPGPVVPDLRLPPPSAPSVRVVFSTTLRAAGFAVGTAAAGLALATVLCGVFVTLLIRVALARVLGADAEGGPAEEAAAALEKRAQPAPRRAPSLLDRLATLGRPQPGGSAGRHWYFRALAHRYVATTTWRRFVSPRLLAAALGLGAAVLAMTTGLAAILYARSGTRRANFDVVVEHYWSPLCEGHVPRLSPPSRPPLAVLRTAPYALGRLSATGECQRLEYSGEAALDGGALYGKGECRPAAGGGAEAAFALRHSLAQCAAAPLESAAGPGTASLACQRRGGAVPGTADPTAAGRHVRVRCTDTAASAALSAALSDGAAPSALPLSLTAAEAAQFAKQGSGAPPVVQVRPVPASIARVPLRFGTARPPLPSAVPPAVAAVSAANASHITAFLASPPAAGSEAAVATASGAVDPRMIVAQTDDTFVAASGSGNTSRSPATLAGVAARVAHLAAAPGLLRAVMTLGPWTSFMLGGERRGLAPVLGGLHPVGIAFGRAGSVAETAGAAAAPTALQLRGAEASPFDPGVHFDAADPEAAEAAAGVSMDFWLRASARTDGFAFVLADHFSDQRAGVSVVSDRLQAVLRAGSGGGLGDSLSARRAGLEKFAGRRSGDSSDSRVASSAAWFNASDWNVYASLHLSAEKQTVRFAAVLPALATPVAWSSEPPPQDLVVAEWHLDAMRPRPADIFNDRWHHVGVSLGNDNGHPVATLVVDGRSSSNSHWRRCLGRRLAVAARLTKAAGAEAGVESALTTVTDAEVLAGATLHVGMLNAALFALRVRRGPTTAAAFVRTGTRVMRIHGAPPRAGTSAAAVGLLYGSLVGGWVLYIIVRRVMRAAGLGRGNGPATPHSAGALAVAEARYEAHVASGALFGLRGAFEPAPFRVSLHSLTDGSGNIALFTSLLDALAASPYVCAADGRGDVQTPGAQHEGAADCPPPPATRWTLALWSVWSKAADTDEALTPSSWASSLKLRAEEQMWADEAEDRAAVADAHKSLQVASFILRSQRQPLARTPSSTFMASMTGGSSQLAAKSAATPAAGKFNSLAMMPAAGTGDADAPGPPPADLPAQPSAGRSRRQSRSRKARPSVGSTGSAAPQGQVGAVNQTGLAEQMTGVEELGDAGITDLLKVGLSALQSMGIYSASWGAAIPSVYSTLTGPALALLSMDLFNGWFANPLTAPTLQLVAAVMSTAAIALAVRADDERFFVTAARYLCRRDAVDNREEPAVKAGSSRPRSSSSPTRSPPKRRPPSPGPGAVAGAPPPPPDPSSPGEGDDTRNLALRVPGGDSKQDPSTEAGGTTRRASVAFRPINSKNHLPGLCPTRRRAVKVLFADEGLEIRGSVRAHNDADTSGTPKALLKGHDHVQKRAPTLSLLTPIASSLAALLLAESPPAKTSKLQVRRAMVARQVAETPHLDGNRTTKPADIVRLAGECKDQLVVDARFRLMPVACPQHGAWLLPVVATTVSPFDERPRCVMKQGGDECGAEVGILWVCPHRVSLRADPARCSCAPGGPTVPCGYAVCDRHMLRGGRGRVWAATRLLATPREVARMPRHKLLSVVVIFAAVMAYAPVLRTSMMIVACHPQFRCEFERCWPDPDIAFLAAVYVSLVVMLLFGCGLPAILLAALLGRRQALHEVFAAPAYGRRYMMKPASALSAALVATVNANSTANSTSALAVGWVSAAHAALLRVVPCCGDLPHGEQGTSREYDRLSMTCSASVAPEAAYRCLSMFPTAAPDDRGGPASLSAQFGAFEISGAAAASPVSPLPKLRSCGSRSSIRASKQTTADRMRRQLSVTFGVAEPDRPSGTNSRPVRQQSGFAAFVRRLDLRPDSSSFSLIGPLSPFRYRRSFSIGVSSFSISRQCAAPDSAWNRKARLTAALQRKPLCGAVGRALGAMAASLDSFASDASSLESSSSTVSGSAANAVEGGRSVGFRPPDRLDAIRSEGCCSASDSSSLESSTVMPSASLSLRAAPSVGFCPPDMLEQQESYGGGFRSSLPLLGSANAPAPQVPTRPSPTVQGPDVVGIFSPTRSGRGPAPADGGSRFARRGSRVPAAMTQIGARGGRTGSVAALSGFSPFRPLRHGSVVGSRRRSGLGDVISGAFPPTGADDRLADMLRSAAAAVVAGNDDGVVDCGGSRHSNDGLPADAAPVAAAAVADGLDLRDVVAEHEWRRFLAADSSALRLLYHPVKLERWQMIPIGLLIKALMIIPTVAFEPSTAVQFSAIGISESLAALVALTFGGSRSPAMPLATSLSFLHQILQVALQAATVAPAVDVDAGVVTGPVMATVTALYIAALATIILSLLASQAIRSRLTGWRLRRLAGVLGVRLPPPPPIFIDPFGHSPWLQSTAAPPADLR